MYVYRYPKDYIDSLKDDINFISEFSTKFKNEIVCKTWDDLAHQHILLIYRDIQIQDSCNFKYRDNKEYYVQYNNFKKYMETRLLLYIKLYSLTEYMDELIQLDRWFNLEYTKDVEEIDIIIDQYIDEQIKKYTHTSRNDICKNGYNADLEFKHARDVNIIRLLNEFDKQDKLKKNE